MENSPKEKLNIIQEKLATNLIKPRFDINFTSTLPDETKMLGNIISKFLDTGDIIVLNGELGSGKTVFMTGVAEFFKIKQDVSSPTFSIVNEYTTDSNKNIFHFDVYRIKSCDEFLEDIGDDYFYNGICFIEWGQIIKDILPSNTITIDITKSGTNTRHFHIWRD